METWPKEDPTDVVSTKSPSLWSAPRSNLRSKPILQSWDKTKTDMEKKPAATVKQGRRAYWKLSVYLVVIHESDPSGKLTHWKNAGYVHEPEVTTEIIRPRGAVFHDSDATPIGKSKGGKDAIYISEKVLKAIHIAKSLGKL